jgi:hypothetical protein
MREQSNARFEAEAAHAFRSKHRDIRNLIRGWVLVNVRVAYEQLMLVQHQHLHDRKRPNPVPHSDYVSHGGDMLGGRPDNSEEHRVADACRKQRSRKQRAFASHLRERERLGNGVALLSLIVSGRRALVDLGILRIDDVAGRAGRKTTPKLLDPRLDLRRSAKQ